MKRIALALALALVVPVAQGQSSQEEQTKELQAELALLKAKTDLFAASYPKFDGAKTGKIENADKLLGMVSLLLPRATMAVGEAAASDLNCSAGTVFLSGLSLGDKLLMSESLGRELTQLEKDLSSKPQTLLSAAIPTALLALGSIVSYAGMFKSDYSVAGSTVDVDENWLIASMVLANPKNSSERFPSRAPVDALYKRLVDIEASIDKLDDKKDKKEKEAFKKRVNALRVALLKPDADGILPIVSVALLSDVSPASGKCLAIVSSASASPLLLTKENIFGKGGRAFLYVPVQASVVQVDALGKLNAMVCKSVAASAPIKLSGLTKRQGAPVPWSPQEIGVLTPEDCGKAYLATQPAQVKPSPVGERIAFPDTAMEVVENSPPNP